MVVNRKKMTQLAQKVARELNFAYWKEDAIMREIATASSMEAAIFRVVKISQDAAQALEILLESQLLKGKRGRAKVAAKIGL